MGTRSLTHVKDEWGETLVTIYRQLDGYPEGMGADLKNILKKGKSKLTNGFGLNMKNPDFFNGMGVSCRISYRET